MVTERRGRKTIPDKEKKINVTVYIQRNIIEKLGGIDKTKQLVTNHLIKTHEKTIRNS